jgi:ABC-type Zn uptake system ZnuABC Zn-binding protein ZnuA
MKYFSFDIITTYFIYTDLNSKIAGVNVQVNFMLELSQTPRGRIDV